MKTKPNFAFQVGSIATLATFVWACGGPQKAESIPTTSPSSPVTAVQPPASITSSVASNAPTPITSASVAEATSPPVNATPLIISIEPRSGSKLKGTAKFETTNVGVKVTLDITGAPAGKHGAHIHQIADCSAKDGKSAGDHFNPQMHAHGLPPSEMRHLGDLGNIEIAKDGTGHLELTITGANLTPGDQLSFLGRGIIIHEKIDDGGQPVGNAGNRIGCGEIKR